MSPSEPGLFDSFELRGKWWLPNAPDYRVHGTLSYIPAQRIELHLDGKFQDPKIEDILRLHPFKTEAILGETVEEESITLYGAFASRVSRTDSFVANALFIGERFSNGSDLLISGALLDYSNLDEWASIRLIKMEKGETAESYRVAIPVSPISLFDMAQVGPFKKLDLMVGVQSSFVGSRFSAQLRTFFDCDFENSLSLDVAESTLYRMASLLSILQGEVTYSTKVRFKVFDKHNPDRTLLWFRVPRIKEPPVLKTHEMNLSLAELGSENAARLFGGWFTKAITLEPVYDLLVGTYTRQSERNKFRVLANALEAFHRTVQGGMYMSKEAYKPIRKALEAAIPPGLDADFHERLKAAIRYGYQYSLRTRLMALLRGLSDRTVEAAVQTDIESFIELVVSVRNYLTHFDEAGKPEILKDTQGIYNLNLRLRAVLIILLFTFLGLPEEKVTDGIVSHLQLAR